MNSYLLNSVIKKRIASFKGEISFLIIQRICEASTSNAMLLLSEDKDSIL